MIHDQVRITLKAGKGGNGVLKFSPGTKRRPIGGDGGKGGDLYIEGTRDRYDLGFLNHEETIEAESADHGGTNNSRGKHGNDMVLKVPLITEVYNDDNELVCRITKDKEKVLIVKGGRGGLGNYHFRKGQATTLDKWTPGREGETLHVKLVLKLTADVVFIGLPNAGKSSMLNALTNAKSKVGNYPFTTLSPHLGSLPGIKFMDLPGLIEGTAEGKGLGSSFLKHTEHAALIAHFITLESTDLKKDYDVIREELKNISKDLAAKKEVIILTKSDMFSDEEIQEKRAQLESTGKEIIISSAYNKETVLPIVDRFRLLVRE
jgi:GTPase